MPKTRVLQNLRLDKIAAVDRPCQEHAMVAIIKRDGVPGDVPADDGKETGMEKKEHDDAIAALKAEHKTALDAQKAETAALKTQLEVATAKAGMSDDERQHMEDMDEDQKKKFLGMSRADRKKLVGKRAEGDETLDVGGATIRKSKVGDDVFAAMKFQQGQIEANAKDAKKAREEADVSKAEKRASEEFPSLPGTTVIKGQIIRAMAGQPAEVVAGFDAVMKAAEASVKGAFTAIGHGSNGKELAKGGQPFLDKVAEIQKRDSVTRLVAMQKAQVEAPDAFEAFQEVGRVLTPAV